VSKRSAFCVLLSAEAIICSALACDPSVVIGRYPADTSGGGSVPEAGMDAETGAGNSGGTMPVSEAGVAGEGGEGGSSGGGTLLWSANHETADDSEWTGSYTTGDSPVASTTRAHGGQYALAFTIDTTDRNTHVMRVYQQTVDEPAYYSAWFFL
jgi:hypothetical protein